MIHCKESPVSRLKYANIYCGFSVWFYTVTVAEQSRTKQYEARRVKISRAVMNKTAELIRVSYRVTAGAGRFSVSSSRTLQQGGSLLDQGLEPASFS